MPVTESIASPTAPDSAVEGDDDRQRDDGQDDAVLGHRLPVFAPDETGAGLEKGLHLGFTP